MLESLHADKVSIARAPVAQWSTDPSRGPKSVGLSSRRSRVRFSSGAFQGVPLCAGKWLWQAECSKAQFAAGPARSARFRRMPADERYISATSRRTWLVPLEDLLGADCR